MPKNKRAQTDQTTVTLVLLDHDGTLCQTASSAYESIKYAFGESCRGVGMSLSNLEVNWDRLFKENTGTTERNLIKNFYHRFSINFSKMRFFEERFYQARAKWYENMKSYNEYIFDTYYPDAETIIHLCNHNKNMMLWLLTGNPHDVIKQRMANYLVNYFTDKQGRLLGAFGDEADSRGELINLAIQRASLLNKKFKPTKDKYNFTTNVIYIGDSKKDFFTGLQVRVKTVWIPSRSLQQVNEVREDDYFSFLKDFLKERIVITNNLESKEVLQILNIDHF